MSLPEPRAFGPPRLLLAAVLLLLPLTVLVALRASSPWVLFLPPALFAVPLLARRILDDPVPVVLVFLLLAVNLDFVKLGETAVSLDILFSSALLYALLVRLGLEGRAVFRSGLERAYLVFLAATLVSVLLSVSPGVSFKNWARDIQYLVFFAFVAGLRPGPADVRRITVAVVLSSVIPCLTGLAGFLLDIPSLYGVETPIGGGETVKRIQATLSHPVVFSHYLALVGALTLSLTIHGRWFRRGWLVPVLALQLIVLYLTYGRTGWVEFAVAVAVILWLLGYRKWLLTLVPLGLVALYQLVPTFQARWETVLETGDNNSFLWRLGLWAYALSLFPERPLFGSGQDTFIDYVSYQEGYASHHTWIGLLVETGAVGMLAFLAVTVIATRSLLRGVRGAGRRDPLAVGFLAGWTGLLAGTFAGDPFGLPSVAVYVWVLLAVVVGRRAAPSSPGPDDQRIRGSSRS